MIKRPVSLILVFLLLFSSTGLFNPVPLARADVDSYEVGTSTSATAIDFHFQNKMFYDGSRYFFVWENESARVVYASSLDLMNWGNQDDVATPSYSRDGVTVVFNLTESRVYLNWVHYAAPNYFNGHNRGNISGSSIDWSNDITVSSATDYPVYGELVQISNAHLQFAYIREDVANGGQIREAFTSDAGAPFGDSWTDNDLPSNIGGMGGCAGCNKHGGLTYHGSDTQSDRALAIAVDNETNLFYQLRNGSGWGDWDNPVQLASDLPDQHEVYGGFDSVLTSDDRYVHVAYLMQNNTIKSQRFDFLYTNWTDPVDVETDYAVVENYSYPVIAEDSTGNIYVAWANDDDVIYYRFSTDDGETWEERYSLLDATGLGGLTRSDKITISTVSSGAVLIGFLTGAGSPYTVRVASLVGGATGDISFDFQVTNLDFNQYVIAGKRYYDFQLNVSATLGYIDTARLRFSDGNTQVTVSYDNVTDTFTILEGSSIVDLNKDISSATSTFAGGTYSISIDFMLYPKQAILDASDVIVYAWANISTGAERGYVNVGTIDILNRGGLTEYDFSGSCAKIPGGDVFDMYCEEGASGSWGAVNITWYKLQHYHARFSLRMSENETGEDQYWQDSSHDGGTEKSSDKGDWQLKVTFYFGDNDTNAFVEGWSALLQMEEGDLGADDYWTAINSTWETAASEGANHTFYGFPTIEPDASLELWMDLWFNKINGSTVHGGRFNPVFYGMHNSGWILWSTWAPFMGNATVSNYFNETKDADGNITNAAAIEFMKVGFNLTRPTTQGGEADFRITLRDFVLSEFKIAGGRMEGVNTPILVEVKVPDMPNTGFLAPLYAAIMSIGKIITDSALWAGQQAWQMLSNQFPWFTDSVETAYEMATVFTGLLTTVWGYISSVLTWITSSISILILPITVIHDAWVLINETYVSLFGTTNMSEIAMVFILVITLMSLLSAVDAGDWPFIGSLVKASWGIASTIMDWSFRIIGFIIKIVTSLKFW